MYLHKRHKQSFPPVNDGPGRAAGAPDTQGLALSNGSQYQQYRPHRAAAAASAAELSRTDAP